MPTRNYAAERKKRDLREERKARLSGLAEDIRSEFSKFLGETITLVRETEARTKALFAKVHNLQIETAEMNRNFAKLLAALTLVLESPVEAQTDAIESMKKFVFDVTKKKGVIN